ncbi:TF-B3 domain-containing protein [Heracleum sosnowskyi]|uniref:TF-B3 domain-containing protein n=1 Tax=Heracleum sosnowskyi TaxID=360622 RepID=A0AAD8HMY2_9APIA|nr:TF-B3 domain-containing protein [Heracleum sosnowskyi]
MASSHCPDSPAKSNHFFKIILSDIESHTKLMVPSKFTRQHGKNLHASVFLKVPNGSAWLVNLERYKGDVWLQNGWPEFARFYSLRFGHLLVFEYRGHVDFQVRIFDPSCTEIDYPLNRSANLNFVESTQMKKRVNDINDSTSSDDVVKFPTTRRLTSPSLKSCQKKPNLQQERGKVGFKSENPFFILTMKPYLIDGTGRPCVPMTFKEAYKKWKHNDQIVLQVAGPTSPVYCTLKLDVRRYRISSGWSVFVRDNSLNVGDVCVFELIIPSRKLFQVSIFRASDEAEKTQVLATSEAVIS